MGLHQILKIEVNDMEMQAVEHRAHRICRALHPLKKKTLSEADQEIASAVWRSVGKMIRKGYAPKDVIAFAKGRAIQMIKASL